MDSLTHLWDLSWDDISGNGSSSFSVGIDPRVRGTAVCNNTFRVAARTPAPASRHPTPPRNASRQNAHASFAPATGFGTYNSSGAAAADTLSHVTWMDHNACYLGSSQIYGAVASVCILVACFALFRVRFREMLEAVDTAHLTPQVREPPERRQRAVREA